MDDIETKFNAYHGVNLGNARLGDKDTKKDGQKVAGVSTRRTRRTVIMSEAEEEDDGLYTSRSDGESEEDSD